jgi:predicted PurR-regulated permease PerM
VRQTALKAFVVTLVSGATIVLGLALWKLKLILMLLFLGIILAAAMRPGVEALSRHRVPRGAAVLVHYAVLAGLIVALLWTAVPRAIDQVQQATGDLQSPAAVGQAADNSSGLKERFLRGVETRLQQLPAPAELFKTSAEITFKAFEGLIGIFFVLATAAYWTFERERAEGLVVRFVPRRHARIVRDTWELIDLKLGAYVRGQALLIVFVATVLSLVFWAIGLPFWLLIGVFAGVVEIVPVIGPLAAGALAVGVGLTESWQLALTAGVVVLAVRLLEDYVVIPKVLGEAVGLSPLVVLLSVTASAVLFGELAVLLAIPLAAVVATLIDVIVLDVDPAEEEVPTVLFPAKETEA